MWFNKTDTDTIYIDKRKEVKPDIQYTWQNLPFKNDFFNLIIFDPPHDTTGPKGIFREKYGTINLKTFNIDYYQAFKELFRILKPSGFLILKWADRCRSLNQILALAEPQKPLIKNCVGTASKGSTFWIIFRKP